MSKLRTLECTSASWRATGSASSPTSPSFWTLSQVIKSFYDECVLFLVGQPRLHFCISWSFTNNIFTELNCRLQRDLNSGCWSRRQALWPLDHHHSPRPLKSVLCLLTDRHVSHLHSFLHYHKPLSILTALILYRRKGIFCWSYHQKEIWLFVSLTDTDRKVLRPLKCT